MLLHWGTNMSSRKSYNTAIVDTFYRLATVKHYVNGRYAWRGCQIKITLSISSKVMCSVFPGYCIQHVNNHMEKTACLLLPHITRGVIIIIIHWSYYSNFIVRAIMHSCALYSGACWGLPLLCCVSWGVCDMTKYRNCSVYFVGEECVEHNRASLCYITDTTTRCSFNEAQTCPPDNPTIQPSSAPSTG